MKAPPANTATSDSPAPSRKAATRSFKAVSQKPQQQSRENTVTTCPIALKHEATKRLQAQSQQGCF